MAASDPLSYRAILFLFLFVGGVVVGGSVADAGGVCRHMHVCVCGANDGCNAKGRQIGRSIER